MYKYMDSHTHYAHRCFDNVRSTLLPQLHENGLAAAVEAAISVESNQRMQESLASYPWIYYAVGLHPTCVKVQEDADEQWEQEIRRALCHEKVVAIGETGLDFHRLSRETPEDKEVSRCLIERQKEWFHKLITIAREEELPLIIHTRDAHTETLEILKKYTWKENAGVIHCFHAEEALSIAKEYIEMGFLLGIGGMVSYSTESAIATRQALAELPLEKLLLETDCPFLLPADCEGSPNHSGNIPAIAKMIAQEKCISVQEVLDASIRNMSRLFDIPKEGYEEGYSL